MNTIYNAPTTGRRPAIGRKPVRISDQCCGRAVWNGEEPRRPLAGELFISGSIPVAFRTVCDLNSEYFIAIEVAR